MPGEDEKKQEGSGFRIPEYRRKWGPACSEMVLSRGVSASRLS